MRTNYFKTLVKAAVSTACILLYGAVAFGQQQVNLTASPAATTLPDGNVVPMWGYTCEALARAVTSTAASTYSTTSASDSSLNMVVNAYVGSTVTAGSSTGIVLSNTATTITLTAAGWTGGTPATGTPFTVAAVTSTATCAPLSGAASPAGMGALGGVTVLNGGSGYTSAPTVTITPALGNTPAKPANAVAMIANGQVTGITFTGPNYAGMGYTAAPTVSISAPTSGTTATATAGPAWSPVLITVPYGTAGGLQINLTNNLLFTPVVGGIAGTPNNIPTSIVIVGQVGGGLGVNPVLATGTGGTPTTVPSPNHTDAQGCATWFIAAGATPPGTPCPAPGANPPGTPAGTPPAPFGAPPVQLPRVQSMATEVVAVAPGTTTLGTSLLWANLKPGTYLLESGTHPSIQVPMGLIGMLVVTTAPTACVPVAPATTCTTPPTPGTAYPAVAATTKTALVPAVQYAAEVPLEFSEIDPVQNNTVNAVVNTAGFLETMVWDGHVGACGNPSSGAVYHTCYPPAVNYTPFYYLINGVAFNKTNPTASQFFGTTGSGTTAAPIPTTGTILARLVNAGLRMHVPSIVGSQTTGFNGSGVSTTVSGFTLIAEDGNRVPGIPGVSGTTTVAGAPRVQTDVFMAAGKVFDVMVNVPGTPTGATAPPSLPIYARDLGLSANSSVRDAGMLAYIGVSGATLPASVGGTTGVFAAAKANPDMYNSLAAGQAFTVSDPSKGLIANDINVYGVALDAAKPAINGTVALNVNGTFTWTPLATYVPPVTGPTDSFGYCANGTTEASATPICTTVTLGASILTGKNPVANNITYTSKMATFIKIAPPGVLEVDSDPNNLPLTVVTTGASAPTLTGGTLVMDPEGGFTASVSATGNAACPTTSPTGSNCFSFNYVAQNSLGKQSGAATVTLVFPPPSGLQVKVVDAQLYKNCNGDTTCISGLTQITDYRWIIEEDKTFWVDPNCTTNSSITTPGCPTVVGGAGTTGSTIPAFGVQFHTSNADYVAQGCTGLQSCEYGQTMLDTRAACTTPPSTTNPAGIPAGCSITAGTHIPAVCDLGAGACRPDPGDGSTSGGFTWVNPSQVVLDPSKRYYISVLPGDAANPFPAYLGQPNCVVANTTTNQNYLNNGQCGHTMSGAPIPPACNILGGPNACPATAGATPPAFAPVNVLVLPTPLPTGKLSVIVFEDDFPLNGEQDGGGGGAAVAPIEPGLGGFNIVLWDTYGGLGDVTGQDQFDDFNQPLSNSLAGTIDPSTGLDACPVTEHFAVPTNTGAGPGAPLPGGITGQIVTCPKYESDNQTLSPLAGQAVVAGLMPEKFSVQAYPGADRIARGEQWVQTNTLDGQHPHDSFIRIGEPSYFQEYGPAGYHVAIGFANPAIINARHDTVCAGNGTPGTVGPCTNTIDGQVDIQRLSRTPDQRLYASGSRDALAWTQCWVSLGDPDGEDFMFTFCDANGNFKFTNVPGGQWRITLGDQWNDQIIDGLSLPANVGCSSTPNSLGTCTGGNTLHMGNISSQQWQSNIYTRTFLDVNKTGIWDPAHDVGIPFLYTMIHYRDGHNANSLVTDFNGVANFNETFPLFNWYVVESDSTRYKTTGIHTVYDAGGPADGSPSCGDGTTARKCGSSTAYNFLANTNESLPLPADLSVPGAVYCVAADCSTESASFAAGTAIKSSSTASTGRIDAPWVWAEGWSGMTSQGNWIDFGKAPYAACNPALPVSPTNFCATVTTTASGATTSTKALVGENGGIHGQVEYASTRPFDDASQMIQQPWEPNVPNVTVNLYQESFAADGVTPTLTLVDTTKSASWDDWAQGFYPGTTAGGTGTTAGGLPYMNCPGQGTATGTNADLFFFTLFDQPNYLDYYSKLHSVPFGTTPPAPTSLPYNSQYKCYDAMHVWNQLQPAPYDGKYFFPSVLGINPADTGGTGWLNTSLTGGVGGNGPGTTGYVAASMPGTNCTICVANPDTTDKYRVGTPMLPPGKYVVQVIMPPGYEVYKEEDKNLLIGDNYIAPVTQQFAGLGGFIFIIPDQASVASLYDPTASGYNPYNYQDSTTAMGLSEELSGVPGFPGFVDPLWPCVGEQRVVPDYLSLFPQAKEVAPFAGATRPLCDRKEVTLVNQMSVSAKFFIYTSTHIASKYTGTITDDFTSEFDPFSPMFGEKFAPPNMPISTRDYLGNEISRVYSDHWGVYDGLTFSSWEVNPPNITGYSPTLMVQCMNDPGPILDTRATLPSPTGTGTIPNPTYLQMINDPLFNSNYSDFCYEEPYMPGLTNYTDTPVVPTAAFIGAAYNSPDCSYPDTMPAIKEVDGDQIGPWLSVGGSMTLTITALGDQLANNSAYSGPSANVAPFNAKTVSRHYGFGTCTLSGSACGNGASAVLIGTAASGETATVPLNITSWTDSTIVAKVPPAVTHNPHFPCLRQQQAQYGGSTAYCGQLVITASNGKQSIDTVTVTVGGKAPSHVSATQSVQTAIDTAKPGDLIIVDPTCTTAGTTTLTGCTVAGLHGTTVTQTASIGSHHELLIMWKPVRLQGVGAATSIINANAQPAGTLLDPWRRHINCLFGLTISGVPLGTSTAPGGGVYDPTGQFSCPEKNWTYFGNDLTGTGGGPANPNVPQVDRIPLESVVGWDATLNGNLAEQLQEPSLMGAYEGAGVTVLSKGVFSPAGTSPFGTESAFPTGSLLLQDTPAVLDSTGAVLGPQSSYCFTSTGAEQVPNPYPSNFVCNPSSIDGLTITNSSQGGGGVLVHGWAHYMQIANNRVYNNAGTLTGGITVGQGEFPDPITITGTGTLNGRTVGEQSALDVLPSCQTSTVVGKQLPFCLDLNVNVHHNMITANSSLGDELFSGTLSGGGAATFCTGADYYKFQYNWVCGNLSSAEGGGVTHLGFMYNGDIEHNSILLNQSTNPTIPTNGGGINVMGTPDTDPVCGAILDADCVPGLSDGTGPNLVINANLIQANMAESGSGGGIRLQQVNGSEVSVFPSKPNLWNSVSITNNMIVNNLAGWDGAGISLQDSLNVAIVNNTIASNDALASSGVLTQSIGTPLASAPAGSCTMAGPSGANTASCPQSAGVTSTVNSSVLTTTFTGLTLTCPFEEPSTGGTSCRGFSNPLLRNNVIWQNRSFKIGVGGLGAGTLNQQNLVSLFTFSGAPAPVQTFSGQCVAAVGTNYYWDIGVRNDTAPGNHASGFQLNPTYSVLDDTGYAASNLTTNPAIVSQYCNGSRVPPECSVTDGCGGPSGYGVPPGIVDASAPNPVFSLTPSATVDEGNNWINVSWGPLALSNDAVTGGSTGNYGGGPLFANYALAASSPAIDYVPVSNLPTATVPNLSRDFFGNPRPDPANPNHFDVGAVEFQGSRVAALAPTLSGISPASGARGTSVAVTLTGTNFTAGTTVGELGPGVTANAVTVVNSTTITANLTISATATLGARNIRVTTRHGTSNSPTRFTISSTAAQTERNDSVTTSGAGNTVQ